MRITFHPRVWLNWLIPPISKLEKQIFEIVISASEKKYRLFLSSQIDNFNYAQRLCDGREVIFYRINNGIWSEDKGEPIKVKNREILWAKLKIRSKSLNSKMKVEAWLLNGRLSCLIYSANPSKFQKANCSIELEYIANLEDADRSVFDESVLPPDLKEAAERYNGNKNGIVFMLPEDTYQIVLKQGNFIVIGEVVNIGVFMVRGKDKSFQDKIYFGKYDGSAPEGIGNSCSEAARFFGG